MASISKEETFRRKRAEYQRAYRERKKQNQQQAEIQRKKWSAYQRAYRERERMKKLNLQEQQQYTEMEAERKRKRAAEIQRAYRKRKKLRLQQEETISTDDIIIDNVNAVQRDVDVLKYTNYYSHSRAHRYFDKHFVQNTFGHTCACCNRIWFKYDLKPINFTISSDLYTKLFENKTKIKVCSSCLISLRANKIPLLSAYNGFSYPQLPEYLSPLDIITERLISPLIPFMQIKRLRHERGEQGIYGQIINVPSNVNTAVNQLPRDIAEDFSINVHIKKRQIHKPAYLQAYVNKSSIRMWLNFLKDTPLYKDITIDATFFEDDSEICIPTDEVSEEILPEDHLNALQQTLLWHEERQLITAPEKENSPIENAEELAFPGIFLGQVRSFREGVHVTPFNMATSEVRRADRRGAKPRHLLYMAAKLMRLRVSSALNNVAKFIETPKAKEEEIQSDMETNLSFLKSIPNSLHYWSMRKKDLFAMLRQLGRPTIFLTLSANETGWVPLIQILAKLQHGLELHKDVVTAMNGLEKCLLVNDDPVCCAIYFDKLLNILITILQSASLSPFGRYRVINYFKRIQFQNHASPQAHILLWLQNAPLHPLHADKPEAINLIDSIMSVSVTESSQNIHLQTHKHNSASCKQCEAPFLPSRSTQILLPMDKREHDFNAYSQRYKHIKTVYENKSYKDIDDFYAQNNITSDDDYIQILRAGIQRPRVFLKRQPHEKWIMPFNPFVLHHLQSNMNIQLILDEYSCATYLADYVNNTNRGVSDLQQKIDEIIAQNPHFELIDITRKLGIDFLNSVELCSQEAAWWLLRKPMCLTSLKVVFIPTLWPQERRCYKNAQAEFDNLDDDDSNYFKSNVIEKYERRPAALNELTLAQFCSKYACDKNGEYKRFVKSKIIRYVNYNMLTQNDNYKREMVLLHIPFRNEYTDVLDKKVFLQIYNNNEEIILQRRKEFDSNINVEEMIRICEKLYQNQTQPQQQLTEPS